MARISIRRVLTWERIPIDAQEVVTKARIVVLAQHTKERLAYLRATIVNPPAAEETTDYYPVPVTFEQEDALHDAYGTERSLELPHGVDPFLAPDNSVIPDPTGSDWTNPANVRDGLLTTYAEYNPSTPSGWLSYGLNDTGEDLRRRVAGFRLVYSYTMEDGFTGPQPPLSVDFFVKEVDSQGRGAVVYATWDFPASSDPAEAFMFLPPAYSSFIPAQPAGTTYTLRLRPWTDAVGPLNVYAFYPLVVDTDLVKNIAKAQLKTPASAPRRVTVRGYVPAGDAQHTIVGWPGGDFTGRVARQSYRDGETVIDFEQAGAPPGLPHEAVEAERVRVTRTQALIRAATYSNLIRR